jgi:hypothetical protein
MAPPISHSPPPRAPALSTPHRAVAPSVPTSSHAAPTAPPPDASRFRDSFVSDGAARERRAHATGRGVNEQIMGGLMTAATRENTRVDWSNPTDTLRHHSQLDSLDATRGDSERCGATALVGGILLSGPEAPRRLADARGRVESSLSDVQRDLTARSSGEWSRPDATSFSGLADASESRRLLRGLPSDTSTWTHSQVSQFEEATYRLGRAEQALHGAHATSGLTGPEMLRLRDTVWGDDWHPTTSDGHAVDVTFAGTRDTGGAVQLNHFVLGTDAPVSEGRRAVVYDPWPQDDGTNRVRTGSADQQLLGGPVERQQWLAGDTAPRAGLDLDAWSGIED